MQASAACRPNSEIIWYVDGRDTNSTHARMHDTSVCTLEPPLCHLLQGVTGVYVCMQVYVCIVDVVIVWRGVRSVCISRAHVFTSRTKKIVGILIFLRNTLYFSSQQK